MDPIYRVITRLHCISISGEFGTKNFLFLDNIQQLPSTMKGVLKSVSMTHVYVIECQAFISPALR